MYAQDDLFYGEVTSSIDSNSQNIRSYFLNDLEEKLDKIIKLEDSVYKLNDEAQVQ